MLLTDTSNPIIDLFKSMTAALGYGLPGIALIVIFITAVLILKQPEKKTLIFVFMAFCGAILIFLAYVGVGLSKENTAIAADNKVKSLGLDTLSNVAASLASTVQQRDSTISSIANSAGVLPDSVLKKIDLQHTDSMLRMTNVIGRYNTSPALKEKLDNATRYYTNNKRDFSIRQQKP